MTAGRIQGQKSEFNARPTPRLPLASTSRKSADTSAKAKKVTPLAAPLRWQLKAPAGKVFFEPDLHLVDEHLWFFDNQNTVYRADLDGQVVQTWQLPDHIEMLLVDGGKVFARDATGMLFDLSRKQPRSALHFGEISPMPGLILHQGSQVVLGRKGVVTAYDARGKERWSVTIKGANTIGLFCADDDGVYLSASRSLQALDWSGSPRWTTKVGKSAGKKLWQSQNHLYVSTWFEGVHVVDKAGELVGLGKITSISSGAATEDGSLLFATANGRITAWSHAGDKQWVLKFDHGVCCRILAHADAIYVVDIHLGLRCIDVSPRALAASARQKLPTPRILQASAPAKTPAKTVAKTPAKTARPGVPRKKSAGAAPSPTAVKVECFQDGKEIRVRVVSKGYHRDWTCQFPRALRIVGARYQVDGVAESAKGGFYRVVGNIHRLPDRP